MDINHTLILSALISSSCAYSLTLVSHSRFNSSIFFVVIRTCGVNFFINLSLLDLEGRKLTEIFIPPLLCGASEVPQRSVKIKIWVNNLKNKLRILTSLNALLRCHENVVVWYNMKYRWQEKQNQLKLEFNFGFRTDWKKNTKCIYQCHSESLILKEKIACPSCN